MTGRGLTTVLLSLLAAAGAYGQGSQDDAAIRLLIRKYVDARNSKDEKATRDLFTADADQLVSSGEWRRGRDALVRGAMASSQKEAGRSSISLQSIRFIEPNAAIADGRYEIVSADKGDVRKMWTSLLVKRTPQGWRITAIRNMLPSLPGYRLSTNTGKEH
jgi:uncharacterized protein (TIGR02246 family)